MHQRASFFPVVVVIAVQKKVELRSKKLVVTARRFRRCAFEASGTKKRKASKNWMKTEPKVAIEEKAEKVRTLSSGPPSGEAPSPRVLLSNPVVEKSPVGFVL